jgi:type III secretory pathway lipoprotein EscJ
MIKSFIISFLFLCFIILVCQENNTTMEVVTSINDYNFDEMLVLLWSHNYDVTRNGTVFMDDGSIWHIKSDENLYIL